MTENQAIKSRNFANFLQLLEGGQIHDDLTAELLKINDYLYEMSENTGRACKGKLALNIDFTRKDRLFEIQSSFKTTLPEYPRHATILWGDGEGNFTPENINQYGMNFAPRQVVEEEKETRSL